MVTALVGPWGYLPLQAPVFTPGTYIEIAVAVTSSCTVDVNVGVNVMVYEGSPLSGHGTLLGTYSSAAQILAPGATKTFTVNRTTIQGSIDKRDVGVRVVYYDEDLAQWIEVIPEPSGEYDDVYYVESPTYIFTIAEPTAREP